MVLPEWFSKAEAPVKVAIIAALAALATSWIPVVHSLLGTPLKYWLEKKALRSKLETEYEYAQRKNLRELIGKYQGRMLEAAETLNHRLWNLYENHSRGWLDAGGDYQNPGHYYLHSSVYRFLNFHSLARKFETEAILIDPRIAESADLDFVKFVKAFHWVISDVALFDKLNYDSENQSDHFFRDHLREICDSCFSGNEFLKHEELRSILLTNPNFNSVYKFFDGLKMDETRLRWDRLVAVHLLLLAFINNFGYEMQKSTLRQFQVVTSKVKNRIVLENLNEWLPKLGLAENGPAKLVMSAITETRDSTNVRGV